MEPKQSTEIRVTINGDATAVHNFSLFFFFFHNFYYISSLAEHPANILLHPVSCWSLKLFFFSSFVITADHLTPLHRSLSHKAAKRAEDKVLTNPVLDTK